MQGCTRTVALRVFPETSARPGGVEVGPHELEQVRDGFARTVRSVARQIERTDQQALGATA